MKTVEWSVLAIGVAGAVALVFAVVAPAATGLASQIGHVGCKEGYWAPDALSCDAPEARR